MLKLATSKLISKIRQNKVLNQYVYRSYVKFVPIRQQSVVNKPENNQESIVKQIEKEDMNDDKEMEIEQSNASNQKSFSNYLKNLLFFATIVVLPLALYQQFEHEIKRFFRKPLVSKLLPDQIMPPGYSTDLLPKTLVLGFEGVLVDLKQDKEKSMQKFQKRPYQDYFISKIKQNYEIVIFSSQDTISMLMLQAKLDPNQEFLQYLYGFEVFGRNTQKSTFKQLDCLNRDMSKVLCVDFEKSSIEGFEDSCCLVKEQKAEEHDEEDKTLMHLGLFLEQAAKQKDDVRVLLAKWGNLNAVENFRDSLELKRDKLKERKNIFGGGLTSYTPNSKQIGFKKF